MTLVSNLKGFANRTVSQLGFQKYSSLEVPADSDVMRAVIPYYLYRPPFGRPRNIDAPNIRSLARTPYAQIISKAIIDYISCLDWEVRPMEGHSVSETQLQEGEAMLDDPNVNPGENFSYLRETLLKDMIELDGGVVTKVFTKGSYTNLQKQTNRDQFTGYNCSDRYNIYWNGKLKPPAKRELSQIFVRDGATFTMNPNMFGVLPEECAYYQYYSTVGHRITAFNRDEIVYMMMNPRSYDVYGWSFIQSADKMLDALMGGINMYDGFYRNNEIPPGFLQAIGANEPDIRAIQQRIRNKLTTQDEFGQYKRLFHKMLIVNNEVKWTPITIPPKELDFIASQEWFFKLLLWSAGMNGSWIGWTDDVNRATDITQSQAFKKKVVQPYVDKLEYYFTTQVLAESGLPMELKFIEYDLEEEIRKDDLAVRRLQSRMITINEWREKESLDPVEWGDEPAGGGPSKMEDGITETLKRALKEAKAEIKATVARPEPEGDDDGATDESDGRGRGESKKKKKGSEHKALSTTTGGPAPETQPAIAIGRGETIDEEEEALADLLKMLMVNETEKIIKEVEGSLSNNVLAEVKATIDQIPNMVDELMKRVGAAMSIPVLQSIRNAFILGTTKAEVQLRMDFVPNENAIKFIQNYTFENIKGMTEEVANDVRQVFQRGLMNGDGVAVIRKDVEKVMNIGRNRAEMIARTELNRAFNAGSYDGYEQSGLDGEIEWIAKVPRPEHPHPQCTAFNGKTRPIGEKFKYKGEEYLYPPVGPNCHSTIAFQPTPPKIVAEDGAEVKAVRYWLKHRDMSKAEMARVLCRSRPTVYSIIEIAEKKCSHHILFSREVATPRESK